MAQAQQAELVQLRQQQAVSQVNAQAQIYYNQRLGQGWDQDHAFEAAQQYAQSLYATNQRTEIQKIANEQAKIAKAREVSQRDGIPFDMAMNYNDPIAMDQAGRFYRETTGRMNDMQARENARNKAPVQHFDTNAQTASGSPQGLKMRYATDPNFNPTDQQLAQMGLS